MTNADGRKVQLTDALTRQRMLAAKEQSTRNLKVACKTIGDERNYYQAALDLASIRRVEKQMAGAA